MIDRFSGTAGRPLLIETLLQQRIVQNEQTIAEKLADRGEVVEFAVGDTIVTQGGTDTDAYFILSGEAVIFVDGREKGRRGPREVVGEMVAVDQTALRAATLKATKPVIALKVAAADFVAAGEGSVKFWRAVSQMIGERLRNRQSPERPPNEVPIMFVGSSVEGVKVVEQLELLFKHNKKLVLRPWYREVFGPSGQPVDELLAEVEVADFALFVFGPDDKIINVARATDAYAPRDNVIFEMGLFIGRLGKSRVFMLHESGADLKIPSDLSGMDPVTYVCKPGCTLASAIGPAAVEIKQAVEDRGVF